MTFTWEGNELTHPEPDEALLGLKFQEDQFESWKGLGGGVCVCVYVCVYMYVCVFICVHMYVCVCRCVIVYSPPTAYDSGFAEIHLLWTECMCLPKIHILKP